MKLLSLWEPWATLMAIGAKRVETRSWPTSYRGWLAIQAAKHFTADEDSLCWEPSFRDALRAGGIADVPYRSGRRFQFNFGCIVAVCKLVDCLPCRGPRSTDISAGHTVEQEFGNYDTGRFAWITSDLFRLPEPIPFKGAQGLCNVPPDVVAQIQAQYKGNGRTGILKRDES